MQPIHPNDYLWQEVASFQQHAHTAFDPAVQALTLYLQVWVAAAAVWIALALVLVLVRAWQNRPAQKRKTASTTRPIHTGRASLEGPDTSHSDLAFPSLQVRY
jgi:hypothetical protein